MAALPANAQAAQNWLVLKGLLNGLGFDQTTLTNFERSRAPPTRPAVRLRGAELPPRPIRHARLRPHGHLVRGFGPGRGQGDESGRSGRIHRGRRSGQPAWDRAFAYGPRDLRVFHLTRRLAALRIDRLAYRTSFGSDPVHDFPREFEALEEESLVHVTGRTIEPTDLGMFYADSIAALLASGDSGRTSTISRSTRSSGRMTTDTATCETGGGRGGAMVRVSRPRGRGSPAR